MHHLQVLAQRAAKGAPNAFELNHLKSRKYAKFLEELEGGHAITMPEAKFHEQFISPGIVLDQARR